VEKHLLESGGYLFYSLLSNAGVYGRSGKVVMDFDFKGLHQASSRRRWLLARGGIFGRMPRRSVQ
jgi:hypothetical protein